jgi:hypothetical protein
MKRKRTPSLCNQQSVGLHGLVAWNTTLFRLLVSAIAISSNDAIAQLDPRSTSDQAVSSIDFLQSMEKPKSTLTASKHAFPVAPFAKPHTVTASVDLPPKIAVDGLPNPIGTGVAFEPTPVAMSPVMPSPDLPSPGLYSPAVAPQPTAIPQPSTFDRWRHWLDPNPQRPDYYASAEILSFRRHGDDGGNISSGGKLNRFGREVAGRYTIGKLDGDLGRSEFVYTSPLDWNRTSQFNGPITAVFPTNHSGVVSLGSFNGSDRQQSSHQARFSSYEMNRRWTGDGLSSFLYGLRLIDYREHYELIANKGPSIGQMNLSTNSLAVGGQMGLNLVRPLSQRFSFGIGTTAGLLGNFSNGAYTIRDAGTAIADKSDRDFRLTIFFQPTATLNYRVTQNSVLNVGYECLYFPGLASTSDQRLGDVQSQSPWIMRSNADQLLYGWSVGFSAKF